MTVYRNGMSAFLNAAIKFTGLLFVFDSEASSINLTEPNGWNHTLFLIGGICFILTLTLLRRRYIHRKYTSCWKNVHKKQGKHSSQIRKRPSLSSNTRNGSIFGRLIMGFCFGLLNLLQFAYDRRSIKPVPKLKQAGNHKSERLSNEKVLSRQIVKNGLNGSDLSHHRIKVRSLMLQKLTESHRTFKTGSERKQILQKEPLPAAKLPGTKIRNENIHFYEKSLEKHHFRETETMIKTEAHAALPMMTQSTTEKVNHLISKQTCIMENLTSTENQHLLDKNLRSKYQYFRQNFQHHENLSAVMNYPSKYSVAPKEEQKLTIIFSNIKEANKRRYDCCEIASSTYSIMSQGNSTGNPLYQGSKRKIVRTKTTSPEPRTRNTLYAGTKREIVRRKTISPETRTSNTLYPGTKKENVLAATISPKSCTCNTHSPGTKRDTVCTKTISPEASLYNIHYEGTKRDNVLAKAISPEASTCNTHYPRTRKKYVRTKTSPPKASTYNTHYQGTKKENLLSVTKSPEAGTYNIHYEGTKKDTVLAKAISPKSCTCNTHSPRTRTKNVSVKTESPEASTYNTHYSDAKYETLLTNTISPEDDTCSTHYPRTRKKTALAKAISPKVCTGNTHYEGTKKETVHTMTISPKSCTYNTHSPGTKRDTVRTKTISPEASTCNTHYEGTKTDSVLAKTISQETCIYNTHYQGTKKENVLAATKSPEASTCNTHSPRRKKTVRTTTISPEASTCNTHYEGTKTDSVLAKTISQETCIYNTHYQGTKKENVLAATKSPEASTCNTHSPRRKKTVRTTTISPEASTYNAPYESTKRDTVRTKTISPEACTFNKHYPGTKRDNVCTKTTSPEACTYNTHFPGTKKNIVLAKTISPEVCTCNTCYFDTKKESVHTKMNNIFLETCQRSTLYPDTKRENVHTKNISTETSACNIHYSGTKNIFPEACTCNIHYPGTKNISTETSTCNTHYSGTKNIFPEACTCNIHYPGTKNISKETSTCNTHYSDTKNIFPEACTCNIHYPGTKNISTETSTCNIHYSGTKNIFPEACTCNIHYPGTKNISKETSTCNIHYSGTKNISTETSTCNIHYSGTKNIFPEACTCNIHYPDTKNISKETSTCNIHYPDTKNISKETSTCNIHYSDTKNISKETSTCNIHYSDTKNIFPEACTCNTHYSDTKRENMHTRMNNIFLETCPRSTLYPDTKRENVHTKSISTETSTCNTIYTGTKNISTETSTRNTLYSGTERENVHTKSISTETSTCNTPCSETKRKNASTKMNNIFLETCPRSTLYPDTKRKYVHTKNISTETSTCNIHYADTKNISPETSTCNIHYADTKRENMRTKMKNIILETCPRSAFYPDTKRKYVHTKNISTETSTCNIHYADTKRENMRTKMNNIFLEICPRNTLYLDKKIENVRAKNMSPATCTCNIRYSGSQRKNLHKKEISTESCTCSTLYSGSKRGNLHKNEISQKSCTCSTMYSDSKRGNLHKNEISTESCTCSTIYSGSKRKNLHKKEISTESCTCSTLYSGSKRKNLHNKEISPESCTCSTLYSGSKRKNLHNKEISPESCTCSTLYSGSNRGNLHKNEISQESCTCSTLYSGSNRGNLHKNEISQESCTCSTLYSGSKRGNLHKNEISQESCTCSTIYPSSMKEIVCTKTKSPKICTCPTLYPSLKKEILNTKTLSPDTGKHNTVYPSSRRKSVHLTTNGNSPCVKKPVKPSNKQWHGMSIISNECQESSPSNDNLSNKMYTHRSTIIAKKISGKESTERKSKQQICHVGQEPNKYINNKLRRSKKSQQLIPENRQLQYETVNQMIRHKTEKNNLKQNEKLKRKGSISKARQHHIGLKALIKSNFIRDILKSMNKDVLIRAFQGKHDRLKHTAVKETQKEQKPEFHKIRNAQNLVTSNREHFRRFLRSKNMNLTDYATSALRKSRDCESIHMVESLLSVTETSNNRLPLITVEPTDARRTPSIKSNSISTYEKDKLGSQFSSADKGNTNFRLQPQRSIDSSLSVKDHLKQKLAVKYGSSVATTNKIIEKRNHETVKPAEVSSSNEWSTIADTMTSVPSKCKIYNRNKKEINLTSGISISANSSSELLIKSDKFKSELKNCIKDSILSYRNANLVKSEQNKDNIRLSTSSAKVYSFHNLFQYLKIMHNKNHKGNEREKLKCLIKNEVRKILAGRVLKQDTTISKTKQVLENKELHNKEMIHISRNRNKYSASTSNVSQKCQSQPKCQISSHKSHANNIDIESENSEIISLTGNKSANTNIASTSESSEKQFGTKKTMEVKRETSHEGKNSGHRLEIVSAVNFNARKNVTENFRHCKNNVLEILAKELNEKPTTCKLKCIQNVGVLKKQEIDTAHKYNFGQCRVQNTDNPTADLTRQSDCLNSIKHVRISNIDTKACNAEEDKQVDVLRSRKYSKERPSTLKYMPRVPASYIKLNTAGVNKSENECKSYTQRKNYSHDSTFCKLGDTSEHTYTLPYANNCTCFSAESKQEGKCCSFSEVITSYSKTKHTKSHNETLRRCERGSLQGNVILTTARPDLSNIVQMSANKTKSLIPIRKYIRRENKSRCKAAIVHDVAPFTDTFTLSPSNTFLGPENICKATSTKPKEVDNINPDTSLVRPYNKPKPITQKVNVALRKPGSKHGVHKQDTLKQIAPNNVETHEKIAPEKNLKSQKTSTNYLVHTVDHPHRRKLTISEKNIGETQNVDDFLQSQSPDSKTSLNSLDRREVFKSRSPSYTLKHRSIDNRNLKYSWRGTIAFRKRLQYLLQHNKNTQLKTKHQSKNILLGKCKDRRPRGQRNVGLHAAKSVITKTLKKSGVSRDYRKGHDFPEKSCGINNKSSNVRKKYRPGIESKIKFVQRKYIKCKEYSEENISDSKKLNASENVGESVTSMISRSQAESKSISQTATRTVGNTFTCPEAECTSLSCVSPHYRIKDEKRSSQSRIPKKKKNLQRELNTKFYVHDESQACAASEMEISTHSRTSCGGKRNSNEEVIDLQCTHHNRRKKQLASMLNSWLRKESTDLVMSSEGEKNISYIEDKSLTHSDLERCKHKHELTVNGKDEITQRNDSSALMKLDPLSCEDDMLDMHTSAQLDDLYIGKKGLIYAKNTIKARWSRADETSSNLHFTRSERDIYGILNEFEFNNISEIDESATQSQDLQAHTSVSPFIFKEHKVKNRLFPESEESALISRRSSKCNILSSSYTKRDQVDVSKQASASSHTTKTFLVENLTSVDIFQQDSNTEKIAAVSPQSNTNNRIENDLIPSTNNTIWQIELATNTKYGKLNETTTDGNEKHQIRNAQDMFTGVSSTNIIKENLMSSDGMEMCDRKLEATLVNNLAKFADVFERKRSGFELGSKIPLNIKQISSGFTAQLDKTEVSLNITDKSQMISDDISATCSNELKSTANAAVDTDITKSNVKHKLSPNNLFRQRNNENVCSSAAIDVNTSVMALSSKSNPDLLGTTLMHVSQNGDSQKHISIRSVSKPHSLSECICKERIIPSRKFRKRWETDHILSTKEIRNKPLEFSWDTACSILNNFEEIKSIPQHAISVSSSQDCPMEDLNKIANIQDYASREGNNAVHSQEYALREGTSVEYSQDYASREGINVEYSQDHTSRDGKSVEYSQDYASRDGKSVAYIQDYVSREGNNIEYSQDYASRDGNSIAYSQDYASREGNNIEYSQDYASREGNNIEYSQDYASREGNNIEYSQDYASREGNNIEYIQDYAPREGNIIEYSQDYASRDGNSVAYSQYNKLKDKERAIEDTEGKVYQNYSRDMYLPTPHKTSLIYSNHLSQSQHESENSQNTNVCEQNIVTENLLLTSVDNTQADRQEESDIIFKGAVDNSSLMISDTSSNELYLSSLYPASTVSTREKELYSLARHRSSWTAFKSSPRVFDNLTQIKTGKQSLFVNEECDQSNLSIASTIKKVERDGRQSPKCQHAEHTEAMTRSLQCGQIVTKLCKTFEQAFGRSGTFSSRNVGSRWKSDKTAIIKSETSSEQANTVSYQTNKLENTKSDKIRELTETEDYRTRELKDAEAFNTNDRTDTSTHKVCELTYDKTCQSSKLTATTKIIQSPEIDQTVKEDNFIFSKEFKGHHLKKYLNLISSKVKRHKQNYKPERVASSSNEIEDEKQSLTEVKDLGSKETDKNTKSQVKSLNIDSNTRNKLSTCMNDTTETEIIDTFVGSRSRSRKPKFANAMQKDNARKHGTNTVSPREKYKLKDELDAFYQSTSADETIFTNKCVQNLSDTYEIMYVDNQNDYRNEKKYNEETTDHLRGHKLNVKNYNLTKEQASKISYQETETTEKNDKTSADDLESLLNEELNKTSTSSRIRNKHDTMFSTQCERGAREGKRKRSQKSSSPLSCQMELHYHFLRENDGSLNGTSSNTSQQTAICPSDTSMYRSKRRRKLVMSSGLAKLEEFIQRAEEEGKTKYASIITRSDAKLSSVTSITSFSQDNESNSEDMDTFILKSNDRKRKSESKNMVVSRPKYNRDANFLQTSSKFTETDLLNTRADTFDDEILLENDREDFPGVSRVGNNNILPFQSSQRDLLPRKAKAGSKNNKFDFVNTLMDDNRQILPKTSVRERGGIGYKLKPTDVTQSSGDIAYSKVDSFKSQTSTLTRPSSFNKSHPDSDDHRDIHSNICSLSDSSSSIVLSWIGSDLFDTEPTVPISPERADWQSLEQPIFVDEQSRTENTFLSLSMRRNTR